MDINSACSGCFAGLSCGSRIEIINLLKSKEKMSVSDIARHFQTSQPTITHHLKYLQKAGVLDSKKEGKYVYYFINPKCGLTDCEVFS